MTGLRVHFLQHNMRDTVIIVEEVDFSHPWCFRCDIMLPWAFLNVCHPNTT